MKDFTTSRSPVKWQRSIPAVVLWLFIWQIASMVIKQEMLLASPVSVARRLFTLAVTLDFWRSVAFSLSRMALGFLLAFTAGVLLSVAAYRLSAVEIFLSPMMGAIKAAPVASYTILCLLLLPSGMLSTVISFTMGLPIIYTSLLEGLHNTDAKLLEMAAAFEMKPLRRIVYIYFSQLMPFLVSSCSVALGLCWKSGIAAEVIGMPIGSIGERLYQAKIFVDTKSVLAWTVVVILISILCEKGFVALLKRISKAIERM